MLRRHSRNRTRPLSIVSRSRPRWRVSPRKIPSGLAGFCQKRRQFTATTAAPTTAATAAITATPATPPTPATPAATAITATASRGRRLPRRRAMPASRGYQSRQSTETRVRPGYHQSQLTLLPTSLGNHLPQFLRPRRHIYLSTHPASRYHFVLVGHQHNQCIHLTTETPTLCLPTLL